MKHKNEVLLKKAKRNSQFLKKLIRKLGSIVDKFSISGKISVIILDRKVYDSGAYEVFSGKLILTSSLPGFQDSETIFKAKVEDRYDGTFRVVADVGELELSILKYYFNHIFDWSVEG